MVKENNTDNSEKNETKKNGKQVVITDAAHKALAKIVAKRVARGIPATMGSVLCELIINENESN